MTYKKAIDREVRNAKRVIGSPHLFSKSLIRTSWLVINSARRQHIYSDFSSDTTGSACSPSQQSTTARLHKLQT